MNDINQVIDLIRESPKLILVFMGGWVFLCGVMLYLNETRR